VILDVLDENVESIDIVFQVYLKLKKEIYPILKAQLKLLLLILKKRLCFSKMPCKQVYYSWKSFLSL